jgi:hypothetical protein
MNQNKAGKGMKDKKKKFQESDELRKHFFVYK